MNRWENSIFHIRRHDYDLSFELHFANRTRDELWVAQPVELKILGQDEPMSPPMLRLDDGDATKLMDELWIAGIRPSKRIIEPQNTDHLNNEISWLRGVVDHLMKRK